MYPDDIGPTTRPQDNITSVNALSVDSIGDYLDGVLAELGIDPAGGFTDVVARLNDVDDTLAAKASISHTHGTGGINDYAITAVKIANNVIGQGQIASGGVGTLELAGGAVTGAKIASLTIGGGNIANGAIDTGQIAAGAITEGKIGGGEVTGYKIASNTVTVENMNMTDDENWMSGSVSLTNGQEKNLVTKALGSGRWMVFFAATALCNSNSHIKVRLYRDSTLKKDAEYTNNSSSAQRAQVSQMYAITGPCSLTLKAFHAGGTGGITCESASTGIVAWQISYS